MSVLVTFLNHCLWNLQVGTYNKTSQLKMFFELYYKHYNIFDSPQKLISTQANNCFFLEFFIPKNLAGIPIFFRIFLKLTETVSGLHIKTRLPRS